MAELTSGEIAELVGGGLRGPADRVVRGVAPLESAGPGELSFVANKRYAAYLQASRAGVILVQEELAEAVPQGTVGVVVGDPHLALYHVLRRLHPPAERVPGVHPTAVIDATAAVDAGATVGPYAVIAAGARVGPGTSVGAHVAIGDGATIGADCTLFPHVSVYPEAVIGDRCVVHAGARIGRDGFGFVWAEGGHRRVPQVGRCILEDDVEIGANSTIDRGSIGDTVIGAGTKIDCLVHLGHNVRVGKHAVMVAQVGVAGSTSIGDGAILAGQVGVAGHLSIGAGARLAAQAGVTGDVPAGETWSGYPARPHREALRAQGSLFRLPDLLRRVRELEKAIFGRGG